MQKKPILFLRFEVWMLYVVDHKVVLYAGRRDWAQFPLQRPCPSLPQCPFRIFWKHLQRVIL